MRHRLHLRVHADLLEHQLLVGARGPVGDAHRFRGLAQALALALHQQAGQAAYAGRQRIGRRLRRGDLFDGDQQHGEPCDQRTPETYGQPQQLQAQLGVCA